jgi:prepilin-type N-terminal cleavage/methylation domain-containing protein
MLYTTNPKRIMSKKRTRQQGFSIIELTVVLAVAGMLIVGALVAANTVMSSMKANRYVSDIALIVTAARAWKGIGSSYEGLKTEDKETTEGIGAIGALIGMGRLPEGAAKNPDGGDYVLTPEIGQIIITTTEADSKTCLNVLAQIQTQSEGTATCTGGNLSAVFK